MVTDNALTQIVDSVLGSVPVVGSGLQNAYEAWHQKNINMAREVLLTNIRQGDVEQMHQDQFFSMLARFSRSVHEGIAKSNLVLLARLITGIGRADKENSKAETFNQYANMLENLTWSEIVFLSRCIKSGEVIPGPAEIKQVLHQKGFFVQSFDTTVSGKNVDDLQHLTNLGDVYRHTDYLGHTLQSPYLGSSAITSFENPFGIYPPKKNDKNMPYKVDIDIMYDFSSRFNDFLQQYGNLWENISLFRDNEGANNE